MLAVCTRENRVIIVDIDPPAMPCPALLRTLGENKVSAVVPCLLQSSQSPCHPGQSVQSLSSSSDNYLSLLIQQQ